MVCECVANGMWGWTPEKVVALGLTQTDDGSGNGWGIGWELKTKNFHLWLDCGSVKLARLNPDTDAITVHVCSMEAFRELLDWIADAEI
jgi:hypothetical protein